MTAQGELWQGGRLPVRSDDAIVPPWKRLHRDIASSGPLRRTGLDGIGVFVLLLAVSDVHGRLPGAPGDTVAQTVGAAIGFPAEAVERPLRALLQRGMLLRYGASGVRFSPAAWARRQHLHAFGQGAEAPVDDADTTQPAVEPPVERDRAESVVPEPTELQRKRAPMPDVERVDRCRYRKIDKGCPATGRLAHLAHPAGMTFEVWLSTEANGIRLLLTRRDRHPGYAAGVTPTQAVTRAETPLSGHDRVTFPEARETTGNVSRAFPVREVGILSAGKEERREDQMQTGNVTAAARETLPEAGRGVTRVTPDDEEKAEGGVPELPSLPSIDNPRVAIGQKLTEGHRALRALIDRANAERRGAVVELGASAEAMRLAALHLQNAGVRAHGDAMDHGVRLFDALVALLRNPDAMRRVLGRWQRVKAAGFVLPLNLCAHNEGQAMQQLVTEAQKIVRNREAQGPCLPLAMPVSATPAVDGEAILYTLDENLQLVEQGRASRAG